MSIINSEQIHITKDFSFLPYMQEYSLERLWAAVHIALSNVLKRDFSFLVPRGWECHIGVNIVDETDDTASPIWEYIFSKAKKESYASAKYSTLLNYRSWMLTGGWSTREFLEMLNELSENKKTSAFDLHRAQIEKLEKLSQMTKQQKEWLRDECSLSAMRGAVRFPFFLTTKDNTWAFELIISMSGAMEDYHDEFLTMAIFKELQPAIVQLFDYYATEFDMFDLPLDRNIRFCMDVLGIQYESTPVEL